MKAEHKKKAQKWIAAIATVLITGLIFAFFAFEKITSTNEYKINTNRQTLQSAFNNVGRAYYSSTINITKVKDSPEFIKYVNEAKEPTDYYNLVLLCRQMRNLLFKELDRSALLSFYCVGTNRVVSANSTQESEYFFKNMMTSKDEIEAINTTQYFINKNKVILVKYDEILDQDVYWITSFTTKELFKEILGQDMHWEFFDRDNKLIYSHMGEDVNLERTPKNIYTDYYSGNYFYYYTPDNFDYTPLIASGIYTLFISFCLIVLQNIISKRRFKRITQELDIPNTNIYPDDIVEKIRKIKDESQVLEQDFREVQRINANDSLRDYFRGVKAYADLPSEIIDTLGTTELILIFMYITFPSDSLAVEWKEMYHYLRDVLNFRVFVMTPEKLIILCPLETADMCLEELEEYKNRSNADRDIDVSIYKYDETNKLSEMGSASLKFDLSTAATNGLDESESLKNKMIQFILNNYDSDISLTDLAEHMDQTEKYVSTSFKYETGINFKKYLTDYRMEEAEKLLLAEDDVKIKTIAKRVGYNSSNTFIRVFKNYFGTSPLVYKNELEELKEGK